MSKTKNSYYQAEVHFLSSNKRESSVIGHRRDNCKECVNELNYFLNIYSTNSVTKIGIFKYWK